MRSRKAAKIYDARPAPSPVLLLKQHKEMLAMAQASGVARCAINEAGPPRSQPSGLVSYPRDTAIPQSPSHSPSMKKTKQWRS